MALQQPPRGTETPPHSVAVPLPGNTSAGARRAAVAATRTAAQGTPPHPTVYAPWTALLKSADARYKAEISAALADLTRATVDAGHLLDQAAAMAEESAGHLERAAWDAWSRYMALADSTRNGILGRATAQYDQAIAWATSQFDHVMSDAEKTYQAIAKDASRAQADVKSIALTIRVVMVHGYLPLRYSSWHVSHQNGYFSAMVSV